MSRDGDLRLDHVGVAVSCPTGGPGIMRVVALRALITLMDTANLDSGMLADVYWRVTLQT
jgi:hypothetical protein